MTRSFLALCVAAALFNATGCDTSNVAPDPVQVGEIHALLHKTFDRPDQTLVLDPLVTSGDFAVVDWVQGEFGGRALLRRQPETGWRVYVCAGDHLKTATGMEQSGVPAADAKKMESDLAKAEATLPKESLAKMSAFMQVMDMRETPAETSPVH